jgi:hypothetical protein
MLFLFNARVKPGVLTEAERGVQVIGAQEKKKCAGALPP